jgi:cathepsin A (carboxypeptidase C)
MKFLAASLLVGAAAASVTPQQPLQALPKAFPEEAKSALSKQLHRMKDFLKGLTSEAAAIWDEVATEFPAEMNAASFFSSPKKHIRRPDFEWDHIVRGKDVQSVWVENASGEQEREVDGKLETYDLRVKSVDPSKLGVDPDVKQ